MIRPQEEETKMPKRKLFKIALLWLIVASALLAVMTVPMVSPAEAD